jgi:hypothetical protein
MFSSDGTGCWKPVTTISHYQEVRGLGEDSWVDRVDAAHHLVIDGPD